MTLHTFYSPETGPPIWLGLARPAAGRIGPGLFGPRRTLREARKVEVDRIPNHSTGLGYMPPIDPCFLHLFLQHSAGSIRFTSVCKTDQLDWI